MGTDFPNTEFSWALYCQISKLVLQTLLICKNVCCTNGDVPAALGDGKGPSICYMQPTEAPSALPYPVPLYVGPVFLALLQLRKYSDALSS